MDTNKVNEAEIKMIKRQTNYTDDTIIELLKSKSCIDIIKEYMNKNNKEKPKEVTSKNQVIYNELRSFMDTIHEQQAKRKTKK